MGLYDVFSSGFPTCYFAMAFSIFCTCAYSGARHNIFYLTASFLGGRLSFFFFFFFSSSSSMEVLLAFSSFSSL
jgi:hypothetical protein